MAGIHGKTSPQAGRASHRKTNSDGELRPNYALRRREHLTEADVKRLIKRRGLRASELVIMRRLDVRKIKKGTPSKHPILRGRVARPNLGRAPPPAVISIGVQGARPLGCCHTFFGERNVVTITSRRRGSFPEFCREEHAAYCVSSFSDKLASAGG
jgi:hypothetical protein